MATHRRPRLWRRFKAVAEALRERFNRVGGDVGKLKTLMHAAPLPRSGHSASPKSGGGKKRPA
jgi:hypothetical protein